MMFGLRMHGIYDGGPIDYNGAGKFLVLSDVITVGMS